MKTLSIAFLAALTIALTGCNTKNKLDTHVTLGLFTPYEYHPEILSGRVIMIDEKLSTEVMKANHPEEGRILEPEEISEMGMSPDFTVYFDTTGMVIKVVYPSGEGPLDKSWLIKNVEGKYIRADWISHDSTNMYDTFTYDANGNLSEKKAFLASTNAPLGRETFRYNAKGEVIEHDFYTAADSLRKKVIMSWDDNNHVTGTEFYNSSDSMVSSIAYTYNDEGFVSNKKIKDDSGNVTRNVNFTYAYDVMGNWVSKTIDDGVKKYEAVRTYTYR
ncbi:MAG TPA: hypothetical protein VE870_09350 [Bacteroidales bacterium]|nr:hypothetical protein [Bacteroidales bacterium]